MDIGMRADDRSERGVSDARRNPSPARGNLRREEITNEIIELGAREKAGRSRFAVSTGSLRLARRIRAR
jgi:hypothetical protein